MPARVWDTVSGHGGDGVGMGWVPGWLGAGTFTLSFSPASNLPMGQEFSSGRTRPDTATDLGWDKRTHANATERDPIQCLGLALQRSSDLVGGRNATLDLGRSDRLPFSRAVELADLAALRAARCDDQFSDFAGFCSQPRSGVEKKLEIAGSTKKLGKIV